MQHELTTLKERLAEITDLINVGAVLAWDMETYMPSGGTALRGQQMGTVQTLAHVKFVDPEIGTLLDALEAHHDDLDYDSDEAALIRRTRYMYDKRTKMPADLVKKMAETYPVATRAWETAREEDDWSLFAPHLQKIVDLKHRQIEVMGGADADNPYDILLDDFDAEITAAEIGTVFEALRPPLVELVTRIAENQDRVDRSILLGDFDEAKQEAFSVEVAEALGYDFERGRLDVAAHPFTIDFGRDDVRITTRYDREDPISAIMSTIHEVGHGMYEQNVGENLSRTGLDGGASASVHESQSRLYENILGRSRQFWQVWYPKLQAALAPHFDSIALDDFYRALNYSQPSLIRVEADEVTYGLHIMLRFELENELFNGRLAVADLPQAWNDRFEAYLGITPPTDREGVLQDIHWAQGLFGYFPDYLLGSIFASQLWEAMLADLPSLPEQIQVGEYDAILGWMRTNIHQHGGKFTFPELAERITGGPLDWQPYIRYLTEKYSAIYEL